MPSITVTTLSSSRIAIYTNAERDQPHLPSRPANDNLATPDPAERDFPIQINYADLLEKLTEIERRLISVEQRSKLGDTAIDTESPDNSETTRSDRDQLAAQLQRAGFSDNEFSVISNIRNNLRLERLKLRDKATREGWLTTNEWTRQLRELDTDSQLRDILGEQRFDDFLLATGRNNRVKIDELMAGSAAQTAGLVAGDLIYCYADSRIFSSVALRRLTSAGEIGESTPVTVLREGVLIDLVIPRGPLGVLISGVKETSYTFRN